MRHAKDLNSYNFFYLIYFHDEPLVHLCININPSSYSSSISYTPIRHNIIL